MRRTNLRYEIDDTGIVKILTKESEATSHGRAVLIIKMEATSPIIAALVDPVVFTAEKAGQHHILQYVGRATPKTWNGAKWDDLDALTVFDWPAP